MRYKLYQVDTFTSKLFGGNPAAVCPLSEWLDDKCLQQIAMENNLAETAFYVKQNDRYEIRWFTPTIEVDLCGHATLAAAHVLFDYEGHSDDTINFISYRSGELKVYKESDRLVLDFPADEFSEVALNDDISACFDKKPVEVYKGKTDYMFVYTKQSDISEIIPRFDIISKLSARGVIITAPGEDVDFVSRFFAPQSGIIEDPVTGSAHTTLTPYWADKINKNELSAMQLSERKGFLTCKMCCDNRVEIKGQAVLYLAGEFFIE